MIAQRLKPETAALAVIPAEPTHAFALRALSLTAYYATAEEAEFVNTALVRLYNQLMADVNDAVPALPTACKYKEPCAANFERGNALA